MSKFFLAFRGGMPKTKEEGEQMMADWNAWVSSLGPAMLDPGAGFGQFLCVIRDHNIGARLCKAGCDPQPDTAPTAGNQCDPAFQ